MTTHEMSHIVEGTAAHTKFGSPGAAVWRDSKFAGFFTYDA